VTLSICVSVGHALEEVECGGDSLSVCRVQVREDFDPTAGGTRLTRIISIFLYPMFSC
jgi:hypothetical protein